MIEYYGFTELVERYPNSIKTRIDLIEAPVVHAMFGLGPERVDELMLQSPTETLTLWVFYEDKGLLDARVNRHFSEDLWLMLELGGEPFLTQEGRLYRGIDPVPHAVTVSGVRPVPQAVEPELAALFQPRRGERVLGYGLRDEAPEALLGAQDVRVAVYDVGQGNANAVVDQQHVPLLYFDLGGGCFWNAHTYPATRRQRFCWQNQPPVVLSHFDFDHLISGEFDDRSHRSTWIVPDDQPFGKRAATLLASIRAAGGRVRFWSGATGPVLWGRHVTLSRPAPNADSRNNSGIVMHVDAGTNGAPFPVLLPGDCGYSFISANEPELARNLRGLVGAHHGSGRYTASPPSSLFNGVVAFSAGHDNSYGHPTVAAKASHNAHGWRTQLETQTGPRRGNIVLTGQPVQRHQMGCRCVPRCSLAPAQP